MVDMVVSLSCQICLILNGSMITRRDYYAKREPSKDASKIFIVCEGEGSEPEYYRFFNGLSSNLELIIIPPEDGTDPLKLINLAKQKLLNTENGASIDVMQKDKVWFAVDTDTWEDEGKISILREFCKERNKIAFDNYDELNPYSVWNVAQSNPCFEIWLYYHHYDMAPNREEEAKCPTFKAFVNSKISGGFDYQKDPVRLKDAIRNAQAVFKTQQNGNPELWSTEQYMLGKDIFRFVESELCKLRNKLG